ncbi:uncharacterized protein CLAFUR5_14650 [Fulvia fulva]|uniref:Uncharacterized protein n=1 Tax=Passalora fulva TaxID=5499 RepID=A0A9Q8PMW3_PASFU|nr:uncharacterized protein CLAFUR5_14650 [Fulvia fulva]KAK4608900.1 hypothetical protein CLAFUR0_14860 [Fulvia fulva]UJO25413.1 hypothetical protein CLAFUR5_14650 [Fulvia fulva]
MARVRVSPPPSTDPPAHPPDPDLERLRRTSAVENNDQTLKEYRAWWKTEHAAYATVSTPTFDYSEQLPEDLRTLLRHAIKGDITATDTTRARCLQSLVALEQSDFWRLSLLDAFGLFGKLPLNNRDFLQNLRRLETPATTSATDRIQVFTALEKVASQRRDRVLRPWARSNVAKNREWAAYDVYAVLRDLQAKQSAAVEGSSSDSNEQISTSSPIRNKGKDGTDHRVLGSQENAGHDEQCEDEEDQGDDNGSVEGDQEQQTHKPEQAEDERDIEVGRGGFSNDGLVVEEGDSTSFFPRLRSLPPSDNESSELPPYFPRPRDRTPTPPSPSPTLTPTPIPTSKQPTDLCTHMSVHTKRPLPDPDEVMALGCKKSKRTRRHTKSLMPITASRPAASLSASIAAIAVWTELLEQACDCLVFSQTYEQNSHALRAATVSPSPTQSHCVFFRPEQHHTEWQLLYLDFQTKRASTFRPFRSATAPNHGECLLESLSHTIRGIKFDHKVVELIPDVNDPDTTEHDPPQNSHLLVAAVAAFLCSDDGPPEQVSPRLWARILDFLEAHATDTHESPDLDPSTLFPLNDPTECERIARQEARPDFPPTSSASSAPLALQQLEEAWQVAEAVCTNFEDVEHRVAFLVAEAQVIRKIIKAVGRTGTNTTPANRAGQLTKELEKLQAGFEQLEKLGWPAGTSREDYLVNLDKTKQGIAEAEKTPAQSAIGSAAAQLDSKVCSIIADFGEYKRCYRRAREMLEDGMRALHAK